MAALSRIANGTHKFVKIKPGDTVVFSSSPIPGNASSINVVVNRLFRAGAKVLVNTAFNNLHTSGHASQEEQKLMLLLTKPKYFFPVHGEYRMLKIHAELSQEVGVPKENTFVLSNGDTILLNKGTARLGPRIHVDDIYVDGNDLSGLSTAVLRDRQILSEDGMVSVLIAMDSHEGKLLTKPVIISRGFVYMKDSFPMIREAENLVGQALGQLLAGKTTFGEIKNTTRDVLSQYFYRKTKRNPMIIPVIMNKNNEKLIKKFKKLFLIVLWVLVALCIFQWYEQSQDRCSITKTTFTENSLPKQFNGFTIGYLSDLNLSEKTI